MDNSETTESGRRPRRNIQTKLVNDSLGMSRKEEQDLKKALYASLNQTRKSSLGTNDSSNSKGNGKGSAKRQKACTDNHSTRGSSRRRSSTTELQKTSQSHTQSTNVLSRRSRRRSATTGREGRSSPTPTSTPTPMPSPAESFGTDEGSQDSVPSSDSSVGRPKRKIYAPRKYAQSFPLPKRTVSPLLVAKSSGQSVKKRSSKLPKTEDFLTFLCFRGASYDSPTFPPHLDPATDSFEQLSHAEEDAGSGSSETNMIQVVEKAHSSVSTCYEVSDEGAEIENASVTSSSNRGDNNTKELSSSQASPEAAETGGGSVGLLQDLQNKVPISSSACSSAQFSNHTSCSLTTARPGNPCWCQKRPHFTTQMFQCPSKASGIRAGEFTPSSVLSCACYANSLVSKDISPSFCSTLSSSASRGASKRKRRMVLSSDDAASKQRCNDGLLCSSSVGKHIRLEESHSSLIPFSCSTTSSSSLPAATCSSSPLSTTHPSALASLPVPCGTQSLQASYKLPSTVSSYTHTSTHPIPCLHHSNMSLYEGDPKPSEELHSSDCEMPTLTLYNSENDGSYSHHSVTKNDHYRYNPSISSASTSSNYKSDFPISSVDGLPLDFCAKATVCSGAGSTNCSHTNSVACSRAINSSLHGSVYSNKNVCDCSLCKKYSKHDCDQHCCLHGCCTADSKVNCLHELYSPQSDVCRCGASSCTKTQFTNSLRNSRNTNTFSFRRKHFSFPVQTSTTSRGKLQNTEHWATNIYSRRNQILSGSNKIRWPPMEEGGESDAQISDNDDSRAKSNNERSSETNEKRSSGRTGERVYVVRKGKNLEDKTSRSSLPLSDSPISQADDFGEAAILKTDVIESSGEDDSEDVGKSDDDDNIDNNYMSFSVIPDMKPHEGRDRRKGKRFIEGKDRRKGRKDTSVKHRKRRSRVDEKRKRRTRKRYHHLKEIPKLKIRIMRKYSPMNSCNTGESWGTTNDNSQSYGATLPQLGRQFDNRGSHGDFQKEFVKMLQAGGIVSSQGRETFHDDLEQGERFSQSGSHDSEPGEICTGTNKPTTAGKKHVNTFRRSANDELDEDLEFTDLHLCEPDEAHHLQGTSPHQQKDAQVKNKRNSESSHRALQFRDSFHDLPDLLEEKVEFEHLYLKHQQVNNMRPHGTKQQHLEAMNSKGTESDLSPDNQVLCESTQLTNSLMLRDKVISAFSKFNRKDIIVSSIEASRASEESQDNFFRSFKNTQSENKSLNHDTDKDKMLHCISIMDKSEDGIGTPKQSVKPVSNIQPDSRMNEVTEKSTGATECEKIREMDLSLESRNKVSRCGASEIQCCSISDAECNESMQVCQCEVSEKRAEADHCSKHTVSCCHRKLTCDRIAAAEDENSRTAEVEKNAKRDAVQILESRKNFGDVMKEGDNETRRKMQRNGEKEVADVDGQMLLDTNISTGCQTTGECNDSDSLTVGKTVLQLERNEHKVRVMDKNIQVDLHSEKEIDQQIQMNFHMTEELELHTDCSVFRTNKKQVDKIVTAVDKKTTDRSLQGPAEKSSCSCSSKHPPKEDHIVLEQGDNENSVDTGPRPHMDKAEMQRNTKHCDGCCCAPANSQSENMKFRTVATQVLKQHQKNLTRQRSLCHSTCDDVRNPAEPIITVGQTVEQPDSQNDDECKKCNETKFSCLPKWDHLINLGKLSETKVGRYPEECAELKEESYGVDMLPKLVLKNDKMIQANKLCLGCQALRKSKDVQTPDECSTTCSELDIRDVSARKSSRLDGINQLNRHIENKRVKYTTRQQVESECNMGSGQPVAMLTSQQSRHCNKGPQSSAKDVPSNVRSNELTAETDRRKRFPSNGSCQSQSAHLESGRSVRSSEKDAEFPAESHKRTVEVSNDDCAKDSVVILDDTDEEIIGSADEGSCSNDDVFFSDNNNYSDLVIDLSLSGRSDSMGSQSSDISSCSSSDNSNISCSDDQQEISRGSFVSPSTEDVSKTSLRDDLDIRCGLFNFERTTDEPLDMTQTSAKRSGSGCFFPDYNKQSSFHSTSSQMEHQADVGSHRNRPGASSNCTKFRKCVDQPEMNSSAQNVSEGSSQGTIDRRMRPSLPHKKGRSEVCSSGSAPLNSSETASRRYRLEMLYEKQQKQTSDMGKSSSNTQTSCCGDKESRRKNEVQHSGRSAEHSCQKIKSSSIPAKVAGRDSRNEKRRSGTGQHDRDDAIVLHSYGSLNTGQGFAMVNGQLQQCEILDKRQLHQEKSRDPGPSCVRNHGVNSQHATDKPSRGENFSGLSDNCVASRVKPKSSIDLQIENNARGKRTSQNPKSTSAPQCKVSKSSSYQRENDSQQGQNGHLRVNISSAPKRKVDFCITEDYCNLSRRLEQFQISMQSGPYPPLSTCRNVAPLSPNDYTQFIIRPGCSSGQRSRAGVPKSLGKSCHGYDQSLSSSQFNSLSPVSDTDDISNSGRTMVNQSDQRSSVARKALVSEHWASLQDRSSSHDMSGMSHSSKSTKSNPYKKSSALEKRSYSARMSSSINISQSANSSAGLRNGSYTAKASDQHTSQYCKSYRRSPNPQSSHSMPRTTTPTTLTSSVDVSVRSSASVASDRNILRHSYVSELLNQEGRVSQNSQHKDPSTRTQHKLQTCVLPTLSASLPISSSSVRGAERQTSAPNTCSKPGSHGGLSHSESQNQNKTRRSDEPSINSFVPSSVSTTVPQPHDSCISSLSLSVRESDMSSRSLVRNARGINFLEARGTSGNKSCSLSTHVRDLPDVDLCPVPVCLASTYSGSTCTDLSASGTGMYNISDTSLSHSSLSTCPFTSVETTVHASSLAYPGNLAGNFNYSTCPVTTATSYSVGSGGGDITNYSRDQENLSLDLGSQLSAGVAGTGNEDENVLDVIMEELKIQIALLKAEIMRESQSQTASEPNHKKQNRKHSATSHSSTSSSNAQSRSSGNDARGHNQGSHMTKTSDSQTIPNWDACRSKGFEDSHCTSGVEELLSRNASSVPSDQSAKERAKLASNGSDLLDCIEIASDGED